MRPSSQGLAATLRVLACVIVLSVLSASSPAAASTVNGDETPAWQWPVSGRREVIAPYRAPAHEYGPGHRGIDLPASVGATVSAPAAGVVAFRGVVVDRPLMTITHAGGLISTFEPLSSTLNPGDTVAAGQVVGVVDVGGHSARGALHFGVRLDGEYINPMALFEEVPRAVLLPCCAPL